MIFTLSLLLGSAWLTGCSSDGTGTTSVEVKEMVPFTLDENQSAVNLQTLGFSFKLLQQVNRQQPNNNLLLSPLSAEMLLAMVCNGADGQTQTQMLAALGFEGLSLADLNSYNRLLLNQLPTIDATTQLALANGLWAQSDFPFLDTYLDMARQNYDAEVSNIDFSQPVKACRQINQWCSDHTDGLIPEVINEVDTDLVMLLANALYFKGIWREPFLSSNTSDASFYNLDGTTSTVRMMYEEANYSHYEGAGFSAISKQYGNGAFRMWFLLPDATDSLEASLARLDATTWSTLTTEGCTGTFETSFYLPHLDMKYERELNDDLMALGISDAFSAEAADFSAMASRPLYLDYVKQFTRLKLDEKGTEAAAVTIGAMNKITSIGPSQHRTFRLDRPFVFFITEANTHAILFAGKVVKLD